MQEQPYSLTLVGKLLAYFLSFCFAIVLILLFPFQRTKIYDEGKNPLTYCHYYISLQSILANYPLLASDQANIDLIKNKMVKFEHDVNRRSGVNIVANYKEQYQKLLQNFGLTTIQGTSNANLILAIAQKTYPLIDDYYLDKRVSCVNPLINEWRPSFGLYRRRILRYNLSSLYYGIPNPYSTILSATNDDWLTGPAPGLFFMNNQTMTMDTRFMTGMPLLSVLYVLPQYNFANVGHYSDPIPSRYFSAQSFIDPLTRKVLNIAGVDIFTVKKSDPQEKKIPNAIAFNPYLNKEFHLGYQSFINTDSYGLAYLANHINYENPHHAQQQEIIVKQFLAHHNNPAQYTATIAGFYKKLMQLKQKHDIILESSAPTQASNLSIHKTSGTVNIKGIIGERAFFVTHCLKNNCVFVFNTSDAPGWHAFVNGKSSPIKRANFAFMATVVPKGDVHVWFIYEPFSHLISYFISMLTLIGVFFALGAVKNKAQRGA